MPLSNSVPEDVGKADQLKDEGEYFIEKLLFRKTSWNSGESDSGSWWESDLRCQVWTVICPHDICETEMNVIWKKPGMACEQ